MGISPRVLPAACCLLVVVVVLQSNRDYTMRMWGPEVVAQFNKVFQEDMQRGSIWSPSA